jgi:hypothetical protein
MESVRRSRSTSLIFANSSRVRRGFLLRPGLTYCAYLGRPVVRRDSASTTSAYFVVREPISA